MDIESNVVICTDVPVDPLLIIRFNQQLESLFYIYRNHYDKYQLGYAYSTVDDPYAIMQIPEFMDIFRALTPYIIYCATNLGIYKDRHIDIVRAWCNKMFKGSSGSTHAHESCDMVAIFYLKAEKDSGKIFFTTVEQPFLFDEQIENKDKYYVNIQTNTLICHDAKLFHGIKEHTIDEPRICMILDLKF